MATMTKKVMVLCAILVVLALPLAAQYVQPGPSYENSNQLGATAGIFSTEVDDFMDVNWYSGVEFEKWFGMMTWDTSGTEDIRNGDYFNNYSGYSSVDKASLGYAWKSDKAYLGLYYNGNILRLDHTRTTSIQPLYDLGTQSLTETEKKIFFYNKNIDDIWINYDYDHVWSDSVNQIDALIGVGGHGFKIGFFESMAKANNPEYNYNFIADPMDPMYGWPEHNTTIIKDTQDGVLRYTNETAEFSYYGGYITPSIMWGTNIKTGESVIRPYAGFALNFYSNKNSHVLKPDYSTSLGTVIGDDLTERYGHNNGYVEPTFTIGTRIGLAPKGAINRKLGFEYGLGIKAYNNDYSDSGFDGKIKGKVNWTGDKTVASTIADTTTTTNALLEFNEIKESYHNIFASFKLDSEVAEGLRLGMSVGLPIWINVKSDNHYQNYLGEQIYRENNAINPAANYTQTVNIQLNDVLTETTEFGIGTTFNIGASYAWLPGRLTFNAGIATSPFRFTNRVTKETPNGIAVNGTSTTIDGNGVLQDKTIIVNPDVAADTVMAENFWAPFSGGVSGGFIFHFTQKMALDFLCSGSWTSSGLDLADVNVLFVFKF